MRVPLLVKVFGAARTFSQPEIDFSRDARCQGLRPEPAFPGQTRAPAIHTRTPFQVTELAGGLDQPWALAVLPDGRLLVTEKHDGQLFILSGDGKQKSPPVAGVPRVDGRGQGGLLDVELAPDHATSGLVYLSYYEPRRGGNGLAVARGRLLSNGNPRLQDLKIIFRMEPTLDSTMHAGEALVRLAHEQQAARGEPAGPRYCAGLCVSRNVVDVV
jgi:glucose/arabinose dehydrogenase